MIIFDQLRISDDGKKMYINAHVNTVSTFAATTIESIYICLGSHIYETQNIDPEVNGHIWSKTYSDNPTEINEVISVDEENFPLTSFNGLFFVYIKCANVPDNNCSYTAIGNYALGVTFDETLLYQKIMQYTKELSDSCKISKGFIDLILLWNGFKAAIETEHYLPAIDFWKKMFYGHHGNTGVGTNICGCNG